MSSSPTPSFLKPRPSFRSRTVDRVAVDSDRCDPRRIDLATDMIVEKLARHGDDYDFADDQLHCALDELLDDKIPA